MCGEGLHGMWNKSLNSKCIRYHTKSYIKLIIAGYEVYVGVSCACVCPEWSAEYLVSMESPFYACGLK